ncbi:MAG: sialate O-acetylesterase [Kiritimatiellia bacterium]
MKRAVAPGCLLAASLASAAVSLPDLFADHAIVQRGADTAIWGRETPGRTVAVSLGTAATTAVAGPDGWWLARLDTSKMGDGPFELKVAGEENEVVSSDILVGEVWLAAGQSNMEFTMKGGFGAVADFDARAAACKDRPIRMFRAARRNEKTPVKGDARGIWRVIDPTNLGAVSAVGYAFIDTLQKTLGGAAGVVDISRSGTRCWAWMSRETVDSVPELKAERLRQEALIAGGEGAKVRKPVVVCWNNQLFPVVDISCRGVIWYQGCCDSGLPDGVHTYPNWLALMVDAWRTAMRKPELPFLYCQLAGWQMPPARPDANPGPARLREGQRRARKLIPHSAMAVILDHSEYEIHGRFKGPAGDRLAALALARVYGKDLVCESPDFRAARFGPDAATLTFDTYGSRLKAAPVRTSFTWNAKSNDVIRIARRSSPASALEGFTIQAGDGSWHWADARITGTCSVRVWSPDAPRPKAVRYAWGMQGFGNLANAAGLPASPFTTEE